MGDQAHQVRKFVSVEISRDFRIKESFDNSLRALRLDFAAHDRYAVHPPPTLIVGDIGGNAEGIAIMVRNKDIRSKFLCEIRSPASI